MSASRTSFFNTHKRTIAALLFGLTISATLAYAVPPGSQYTPGATLNPNCIPGTSNCTVDISSTTGAVWGSITGTLSDQTDLQNALDDKFDDPTGTTAQYIRGDGTFGTSPINYVDNSYVGRTSGPGADGANGGGGYNILLGDNAGFIGQYLSRAVFLGDNSGYFVGNSGIYDTLNGGRNFEAVFIGYRAGYSAEFASGSIFIGSHAGESATTATNSIFIGTNAGLSDIVDNATNLDVDMSILIGANTRTGGFVNSILLGNGTPGSPISNTKANQFMLADTITDVRWRGVEYNLPASQGGAATVLVNDGSGNLSWGSGSGLALQTNGTPNGSQTLLNLVAGTNVSINDTGSGTITIDAAGGGGGGGTVTSFSFSNGNGFTGNVTNATTTPALSLTQQDAAADGSTKGKATFTASDFDATSGLISLDYTNGQAASGSTKGFLTASNWTTFNNKLSGITFINGNGFTGSVVDVGGGVRELAIAQQDAAADGSTKGKATFTASDFDATSGLISLDYTNGQAASGSTKGFLTASNWTTFNNKQAAISLTTTGSSGAATFISNTLNIPTYVSSPITIQNTTSLFSTGLTGTGSGSSASGAVFLGTNAGLSATTADGSNFFGVSAGESASAASNSNFFGFHAGKSATNAYNSTFVGENVGENATNANRSIFIGYYAGSNATNAANSVFLGTNAGQYYSPGLYGSTNSANAIFIGTRAGSMIADNTLDNTAAFDESSTFANTSIVVGHRASTGGFSNSIALGAYATNTAVNQFMIGSSTRPIDSVVFIGTGGTSCTITTGTSMSCSSDERLKTNIEDLNTGTLDTLLNVRTVSYNWNANPEGQQMVGFLAQDLQNYFPQLVSTGPGDYLQVNYAGMTPILVEAIREINQKIVGIGDLDETNTWRDALVAWFASATNGIGEFFAGTTHQRTLCIGEAGNETCITKSQLDTLLTSQASFGPVTQTPQAPEEPVVEEPTLEQHSETESQTPEAPESENTSETTLEPTTEISTLAEPGQ